MKAFITLCHKNHSYDGTLTHLFRAFIKTSLQDCDVVIFPVTYQNEYVADEELMSAIVNSGKKIVIVDFVEYGWDATNTNHFFGLNTREFLNKFQNGEYLKLDDFFKNMKELGRIALYFKRELNESPITDFDILPAEYPGIATLPDHKIDTFDQFNSRPIDILMVWGLSNPSRPILHGELLKQSALNGQHLVSSIDHVSTCLQRGDKRMVVLLHIPDFARVPIEQILMLQSLSKITVSLNGAGVCCFRDTESSYNSVLARQENNKQWTYPWIERINAIGLPNKKNGLIDEAWSYSRLMGHLEDREGLYNIYLHGTANWKNYEVNNYSNYILNQVREAI